MMASPALPSKPVGEQPRGQVSGIVVVTIQLAFFRARD